MILSKRGLITGLSATIICAPSIVRVTSLMAMPRRPFFPITMEDMRQAVIDYYQRIERLGLVEGSQLFAESLEVEINPFDPKRVDVVVKPMFVQQLRIVADLVGKHPELEEPYDRGQKVRVSRILG